MTTHRNTILQGDSLTLLRTLPAESVQLVLTSPPYWGLRDYKSDGASLAGQWGGEATPEEHIARLVEWAGDTGVRRVLRKDGALVLNYGESFAASRTRGSYGDQSQHGYSPHGEERPIPSGLKPKDLLGMPWRIAQAFQADGWWWRCWWPWVKANGMPESCTDRPAMSCEVMLMFTRSRRYYWDQEAVRVGYAPATIKRADGSQVTTGNPDVRPGFKRTLSPAVRKTDKQRGHSRRHAGFNDRWDAMPKEDQQSHGRIRKNGDWWRESVGLAIEQAKAWVAHAEAFQRGETPMLLDFDGLPLGQLHPTYAYPGSHFATYPPALVRPIIRAATSERGECPGCGAPWVREVGEWRSAPGRGSGNKTAKEGDESGRPGHHRAASIPWQPQTRDTTGWHSSCDCNAGEPVPQIVLDPFSGTGTTCVVAAEEGRDSLGIDLYGGNYNFGGHTAMDRLRAAAGEGPPLEQVAAERESGQMTLIGE